MQIKRKRYIVNWRFQLKYILWMFLPVLVLGIIVLSSVYNISKSIMSAQKQQLISQVASLKESLGYLDKFNLEDKINCDLLKTNVKNLKSFSQDQININSFALAQLNRIVSDSIFIFAVGLFLLGVIYSHRIAGPIFRLQRILKDSAQNIYIPIKVRPADEFQEFFETLENMRKQLLDNKVNTETIINNAIQKLERIKRSALPEISIAIEELKRDLADLNKI